MIPPIRAPPISTELSRFLFFILDAAKVQGSLDNDLQFPEVDRFLEKS